ncbi:pentapeptide repeat-containing protein [Methylovirgula sp. 4M-Z18]|uniref:pentapeptide repeat-containing protein n=1 Tax=Methylovirgula sp. 4M-Z18 TaxID=2293567 RepID=UPI000E2E8041|nr:pentapeptide repeat-containing protein [Methylovirgula sp. 4M-Z18]RFB78537.1 pentapeptide repeat-containing protein [Methylovirgula sp. 4M-Z18]
MTVEKPLKPANESIWYCLLTLHGELTDGADADNKEIHGENLFLWNAFRVCVLGQTEDPKTYIGIANRFGQNLPNKNFEAFVANRLQKRMGAAARLPGPEEAIDLSGLKFDKPVSFAGFLLPSHLSFEGSHFIKGISFEGVQFKKFIQQAAADEISFKNVEINAGMDLFNTAFSQKVDFQGLTVRDGDTIFRQVHFQNGADFTDAKFEHVTFSGSHFSVAALFDSAQFGRAQFRLCKFYNSTKFTGANFVKATEFVQVEFFGSAHFDNVRFENPVLFDGCRFLPNTELGASTVFQFVRFDNRASFLKTEFGIALVFKSFIFNGDASFEGCIFSNVRFGDLRSDGKQLVLPKEYVQDASAPSLAVFSAKADFRNAELKNRFSFHKVNFKKFVPDFRGARMHEATEFNDVIWPQPPTPENIEDVYQHVWAYERLKMEMDRLKKHADEQFFFRKELRVRRMLEKSPSARALDWLYEISSDYGGSVKRPLEWIGGILAVSLCTITASRYCYGHEKFWTAFRHARDNTVGNFISFLSSAKDLSSHSSTFEKYVGILEGFSTAIFLFLLILALRNKFRLK